MHQLTRDQARQVAVRAQLLAEPRPTDLLEGTAVLAEVADLAGWLRVEPPLVPGVRT